MPFKHISFTHKSTNQLEPVRLYIGMVTTNGSTQDSAASFEYGTSTSVVLRRNKSTF